MARFFKRYNSYVPDVHLLIKKTIEPSRGKTNVVVSEQVRHKPSCAVTENG